jgi:hypothetical protein
LSDKEQKTGTVVNNQESNAGQLNHIEAVQGRRNGVLDFVRIPGEFCSFNKQ